MPAPGQVGAACQPATRWLYGPSVDVQARPVEVLAGAPFEQVMKERVLEPLGMRDTQYTLRPDQRKRISALHTRQPDGSKPRHP
ncbi:MAG TPA: serine hydrolase domain-containing protein [Woeseiaceae bacterium]